MSHETLRSHALWAADGDEAEVADGKREIKTLDLVLLRAFRHGLALHLNYGI